MRRLLLPVLLSLGILAGPVLTAPACLWDRETENQEREFKSDYLNRPAGPAPPTTPVPYPTGDQVKQVAAVGVGLALLAGSFVVGLGRGPKRP